MAGEDEEESVMAPLLCPLPNLTADQILLRPRYGGVQFSGLHWTGEDVDRLRVLCDAKSDIKKSADALGRPPSALVTKARVAGIILPPGWVAFRSGRKKYKAKYPRALIKKIREMSAAGATVREIATVCGFSALKVDWIRKRYKIKRTRIARAEAVQKILNDQGGTEIWDRRWKTWRPEEIQALRVLCENGPKESDIDRLAKLLRRTPMGVASKANELGLPAAFSWQRLIRGTPLVGTRRNPELHYPYVAGSRSAANSDLLAVNDLVPKGLPPEIRADVCQDIMLAVFEGKASIESLRKDQTLIPKFIRKFFKENTEARGFAVSLDEPRADGRSWHETLRDPRYSQEEAADTDDAYRKEDDNE